MNRSKDLDAIAPDDPVIVSPKKSSRRQPHPVKSTSFSSKTLPDNKIYNILGHTQNSLSSFLVKPKVLSFREQDEGEQIYLAIRSHWITNIRWIITFIFMMFVPLLFKYLNFFDFLPFNYQLVLLLFWYLITFISAFENFCLGILIYLLLPIIELLILILITSSIDILPKQIYPLFKILLHRSREFWALLILAMFSFKLLVKPIKLILKKLPILKKLLSF